jgi:hypothetical protein
LIVASIRTSYQTTGARVRTFNAAWQALLYAPAAWIESKITGTPVYSGWRVSRTSQAEQFSLS